MASESDAMLITIPIPIRDAHISTTYQFPLTMMETSSSRKLLRIPITHWMDQTC
jgi:hypothetical protein